MKRMLDKIENNESIWSREIVGYFLCGYIIRFVICALVGLVYFGIKNISLLQYDEKTVGILDISLYDHTKWYNDEYTFYSRDYYVPYYSYEVDGEEYVLRDGRHMNEIDKLKIGDKRTIYYKSENPEQAITLKAYPTRMVFIGALILFPDVFVFLAVAALKIIGRIYTRKRDI